MKLEKVKGFLNRQLRQTFSRVIDFIQLDTAEPGHKDRALLAMMKWALMKGGHIPEEALSELRQLLAKRAETGAEISELVEFLRSCTPMPPSEGAIYFQDVPEEEKRQTVTALITLSIAAGSYDAEHREEIILLAKELDVPLALVEAHERSLEEENRRRIKLMRSGTGLLVAFIVLVVFVLTATLLRSVIFGLILAYICLPLEKFLERKMLKASPFTGELKPRKVSFVKKIVRRIKRFIGNEEPLEATVDDPETHHRTSLVTRASTLTVALVTVLLIFVSVVLIVLSINYVSGIGHTVKNWTSEHAAAVAAADTPSDSAMGDEVVAPEPDPAELNNDLTYQISVKLDQLKHNFQRIPWVSRGIDQISQMLNDPDSQQKFWSAVLQRSGGLLQLSLGTLSGIAAILVDILLTIFFFSLFLRTIALNTDSRGKGQSLSSYLVRTVFNGSWLPEAKEETLAEGERIIGGVVFKLKAWLRGYIILVSIDTIVYSTVFYLLGVPYAPILGFLAGCGLLLPYIGPIASALLTILVTLAIGGDTVSGLQIAGIIGIYLFHNGIVEQFFLYPAVIGETLGLTTLETIIVVLLGAIFAGITGMIFAMPAAAVIKYLVPQFYRTVRR